MHLSVLFWIVDTFATPIARNLKHTSYWDILSIHILHGTYLEGNFFHLILRCRKTIPQNYICRINKVSIVALIFWGGVMFFKPHLPSPESHWVGSICALLHLKFPAFKGVTRGMSYIYDTHLHAIDMNGFVDILPSGQIGAASTYFLRYLF